MAISGQKLINIGAPNSTQNSDSLYTAFTKINENFTTVFTDAGPNDMAVPDVYYVAKNGSDSNDGTTLGTAFLTIKAACEYVSFLVAANPARRISVFVKAGDYTENNPVIVPPRVAIIGDSLRSVSVRPADTTNDTFYVNNGSYVTGITFRSHLSPYAAIAFNPDGSAGNITTSPYIQNCSSITTTGCGIRVDGNHALGIKGMVMDAFTQYNQGGLGVHILNGGYAQLVSIFTICTTTGILCENGGQCSVTNSNCSFGDYGLVATGVGAVLDTCLSGAVDLFDNTIVLTNLSARPAVNDVVKFTGVDPEFAGYYTVDYASPLVSGSSIVRIQENVPDITVGKSGSLYRRSLISSSGQTFEYVGAGTNVNTALPSLGGVPIQENEVVMSNGGIVYYTSTDQKGDFRVGDGLTINNASSTISGRPFIASLFANMAPYILALS
jgi:hypothetical protein